MTTGKLPYRLRPCTDADHAWAYALKCDAYREVVERQFGPWDEAFQRELFDRRCWKPAISHLVLVADVPAGLIAWEDRGDHLWLDEIQVVRAWRGRGLGSMLLRDLLAQAHALQKSLRLQVLRENSRAQALYRRLGFNLIGETATHLVLEHVASRPSPAAAVVGATYVVSTDPARLDVEFIVRGLQSTYWAGDRLREVIVQSLAASLCFGAYVVDTGEQVGFARIVSDGATFSWLCDVFVAPAHRRRGLGKRLVAEVVGHPRVKATRVYLGTRDAHGLYAPFGFARWEVMRRP